MNNPPRHEIILALETAVDAGSLALFRSGGEIPGAHWETGPVSRAENLLKAIDELLLSGGVALADIETIAVSTGPGSFTGIRIGIATAMGLAKAADARVLGFSVLNALVELANRDKAFAAVPIGKLDVGIQSFEKKGGLWSASSPAESIAGENLAEALSSQEGTDAIVHPGLARYLTGKICSSTDLRYSGENLADLIVGLASRGVPETGLEPIYLQNPARSRGLFQ